MIDRDAKLEELTIELLYLAGDTEDERAARAMRAAAEILTVILAAFQQN